MKPDSQAPPLAAPHEASYLLPDSIVPLEYLLSLRPNLEDYTFTGFASIAINVRKPTYKIELHAADIEISTVSLLGNSITKTAAPCGLIPKTFSLDPERQTLSVEFRDQLLFGPARLEICYAGKINDKLCGWYRTKFAGPDGRDHFAAVTQAQPFDARRIFPCWDEPRWKVPITLDIVIPNNQTAISNMPISKESTFAGGRHKYIRFMPTPPMSTYLFALIVGEFECIAEGKLKDGKPVKIWAVPGNAGRGSLSCARSIKTLDFFSEYYNYPYPWPKADLIAVPDFGAGAMENLGADTFREPFLLHDPKNTSEANLETSELVIDHEMGHQWHGDLVTCRSWDGTWLNESFATWTELLVARNLDPQKRAEDRFVAEDFVQARDADSLKANRPIHVKITSQDEIEEVFDAITYSKGGSVLRMLEYWLGREAFRNGIQNYIRKHEYGSVEPEDLWNALETTSGKSVREMMHGWTHQTGLPVILVEKCPETEFGYQLTQQMFLYERNEADQNRKWIIPIGWKTATLRDQNNLVMNKMNLSPTEIQYSPAYLENTAPWKNTEWFMLNPGGIGFFRVYYEVEDLMKLRRAIERRELTVSDRIVLLDDVFALTRAGYYNAKTLLDFVSMFSEERDLRVWQTALYRLKDIDMLVADSSIEESFTCFKYKFLMPAAHYFGWDERKDEESQDKIARGMILRAFGQAGNYATIVKATELLAKSYFDREYINPNTRSAVYGIAANNYPNYYDILLKFYREAELHEEKERLFRAMAEFSEENALKKTLAFFLSDEMRAQDVYVALRAMGANPKARKMTWQFVKDNWVKLSEMYDGGTYLGAVISASCDNLDTPEEEAGVRAFFETHPVPDAKRAIEQALENIRINAAWKSRDLKNIREWLAENA